MGTMLRFFVDLQRWPKVIINPSFSERKDVSRLLKYDLLFSFMPQSGKNKKEKAVKRT
jgi:hypothetical protein